MTVVLRERRLQYEGLSFTLLKSLHAEALAVEALPSVEAAAIAARLIELGRRDGTLKPFGTLAVAFSGRSTADRLVVNELREACVYLASDDRTDAAIDKASSFLDDVEARMPEIQRIADSALPNGSRRTRPER